jgi:WD40 repeat protein
VFTTLDFPVIIGRQFTSFYYICVQVLDIVFDYTGHRLATASSDATACIWDVHSEFKLLAKMKGHREEVSKVILLVLLFQAQESNIFCFDNILFTQCQMG